MKTSLVWEYDYAGLAYSQRQSFRSDGAGALGTGDGIGTTHLTANGQNATPNRESNIYAHHKHQAHRSRPLVESTAQVDDEVRALLRQTDDPDKQFGNGSR